jgi:hypothetical protein
LRGAQNRLASNLFIDKEVIMNNTTMAAAAVRASVLAAGALLALGHAWADAGVRPIYRCEVQGQSVFSDRPCGIDASAYEADTARVSITQSVPAVPVVAAPTKESKPATRRRGSAGGNEVARHAAACERIDTGLREIRARMRAGYSAKQGERLKERQQELQARRRVSRCR